MRKVFRWVLLGVTPALVLLGLGSLAKIAPGAPVVAVAIAAFVFLLGARMMWRASRVPPRHDGPAEEVADLDVFFVCEECGTEFRVEKIGELQVPRHCGERMRAERRRRVPAPELN